MKQEELIKRQHMLLNILSRLPKNILLKHSIDRLPEFVLHEIACEDCFDFNKAAFLVDNPDFDCLKGVAGVSREESFSGGSIWDEADNFTAHMASSPFNDKVRNHLQVSCKKCDTPDEEVFAQIAQALGMGKYGVCEWNMKHDNHGYLIYEKMNHDDTAGDEYLLHGASLLGFCPIY